jgi:hypothetical protein
MYNRNLMPLKERPSHLWEKGKFLLNDRPDIVKAIRTFKVIDMLRLR